MEIVECISILHPIIKLFAIRALKAINKLVI
jgi:hypothetical protein